MIFDSNLRASLILIRAVLFIIMLFPWLLLVFFDKGFIFFAILANIVIFAVILNLKLSFKIIIYPQEHIVEYYCMKLWGKKYMVSINIKNAYINLGTTTYKGNKVLQLIIKDNNDPDKKISLTEALTEFNEKQLSDIYRALNQVLVDQDVT